MLNNGIFDSKYLAKNQNVLSEINLIFPNLVP